MITVVAKYCSKKQNYVHGAGDYCKISLFRVTSATCHALYLSCSDNDLPALQYTLHIASSGCYFLTCSR